MLRKIRMKCACLTDIGTWRERNEDNFYFNGEYLPQEHDGDSRIRVWEPNMHAVNAVGVFDGMGGESAGDLASYTAVGAFHRMAVPLLQTKKLPEDSQLTDLIREISGEVYRTALANRYKLIGSTCALLFFHGSDAAAVNLGDSPIYLLRRGSLRTLYEPHTDAALYERLGVNRKPGLTQFLGLGAQEEWGLEEVELTPHISRLKLSGGDILLLCSDGLTDMVEEKRICAILEESKDPYTAVGHLRREALENGGRDNITIVLGKIE